MHRKAVSVIIAAYNAADTIASAISSALAEPETGEVIVVDDCSTDGSIETAILAGGSDKRMMIVRQDRNQGPAAARNRAIEHSTQPFIAILDADDRFLPGRLKRVFTTTDWDFCADNIAFITDRAAFESYTPKVGGDGRKGVIDLESFLIGNRNSNRVKRNELGFLKPVMRREFLDRHTLSYVVDCRLGEDFLLYAKALARGARFKVYEECGYVAHERPDSLSGSHGVDDLRSFLNGLMALEAELPVAALPSFEVLCQILREKIDHREVLDIRRQHGLARGLLALGSRGTVARDILRDKLSFLRSVEAPQRVLIPPRDFDRIRT